MCLLMLRKRALGIPPKSPKNSAKEPYKCCRRALHGLHLTCFNEGSMHVFTDVIQKSPRHSAKEPYEFRKRALWIPRKSPMNSTKEPHEFCEFCKKPLLNSQKSPMNFAKNPMNFAIEPYEFCQRAPWIPQKSPRTVNVSMRVISNEIPISVPSFCVQTSGLKSLKEPSSEALWAQGLKLKKTFVESLWMCVHIHTDSAKEPHAFCKRALSIQSGQETHEFLAYMPAIVRLTGFYESAM